MKARLLVVTSTFPRWKDDTDPPFVYELSRRLTSDFDVVVHTPHYHGSLSREFMDGMRIHRFRYFFSRFEKLAGGQGIVPKLRRNRFYFVLLPFFIAAQCSSLLLLVYKIKPNIIHAHWLIPQGFLAVLMKWIFGVPVIVTAHGADVFSLRERIYIWLKKVIVNNADRIVTVSNSLAKTLIEDTQPSIQPDVIPMGVDASIFSPHHRSNSIRQKYGITGPFLLFVGRLTEKKGVQYLIDAMIMVNSASPESKLLIVGHGELEQILRKQVEDLDLQDIVLFVGGLVNKELAAYYASADIFIGPSIKTVDGDSEGFGLTFVEAAMSGCLVIGSKVGGLEDIIEDGTNGFLVPPGDSIVLAERIIYLLKNIEKLRGENTQTRRQFIAKYDWNIIAEKYGRVCLSYSEKSR
jgi:glycosyltransferase involved in cell wall biosynthesis